MGKEDLTETAGDEGGHIGHIVSMDEKGKFILDLKFLSLQRNISKI